MKWELHPKQSELSRALYVIRLRRMPFRSGGRWIHVPESQRVSGQRYELARLKPTKWTPKPWQKDGRRISPREELMGDRRSMTRYAYAGWMRFYHGKGMPLVGRPLLYCVSTGEPS